MNQVVGNENGLGASSWKKAIALVVSFGLLATVILRTPPNHWVDLDSEHPEAVEADFRHGDEEMQQRERVWDLQLPLPLPQSADENIQQHPHLVFVKGLKVGGTTVAYALNQVAKQYNVPLAKVTETMNRKFGVKVSCEQFEMYFHHGYKNAWQEHWYVA